MRSATWAPLAVLLLVSACKSEPPPPTASSSTAAAPVPTVSAAPAAAASSAAAPADASTFAVIADGPDAIALYGLAGGAMVDAAGFLAVLGDGPLVQDPAAMLGLKKGESGPVKGAWPDAAWLEASADGKPKLYKWVKERWAEHPILRDEEQLLDVTTFGEGRVVGAIGMPTNDIRMQLMGGKGGVLPAPHPPQKKPPPPGEAPTEGTTDENNCKVAMSGKAAYRLAGTPSGHVFAVGYECAADGGTGAPVAERWEPNKNRGTVEPLPKAEGGGSVAIAGVVARSGEEAVAFGAASGKAWVARWDGKAWALDAAALPAAPVSMSWAADGALFAATKEGLFQRGASAWDKVALPSSASGAPVIAVVARSATDVWVAAATPARGWLLRSPKSDVAKVGLPARREMADSLRSNLRYVASAACTKPYAHLFSVGPTGTAVPAELPNLKKALAGKPGIEGAKLVVEDDGRNVYVGAKAPSFAVADTIAKLYLAEQPKAGSRVFCHDPIVKKELSLE